MRMLTLKRLATFIVLFGVLFCVLLFGAAAVEVGISHARATAQGLTLEKSFDYRRQFQHDFAKRYGVIIVFGALWISFASSLTLAFSGIFPWCKKKAQSPPVLQAS